MYVDQKNSEYIGQGMLVTEASSIGLKPNEWPDRIPTSIGNGQPFILCDVCRCQDGIESVDYKQLYGCLFLTVFND